MARKKVIVEGAFGLKLHEQTARLLDSVLPTLPQEYRTLKVKSTLAVSEFVLGERADISLVSTDSVDADNEVVIQTGLVLEEFQRNPVVLWSHNMQDPPIGKCQWIKRTPAGTKAKTIYASRPKDYFGDFFPEEIFGLIQQDMLKGKSIGYIVLEARPPTAQELATRPDWTGAILHSKALLLEYSACSIPANQDALVEAVSKGYKIGTATKAKLGITVPDPIEAITLLLKSLRQPLHT